MNQWRNVIKMGYHVLGPIWHYKECIIFDTETTGLEPEKNDDQIIQFSAVRYKVLDGFRLEEVENTDFYIKPRHPISQKITDITGITNEDSLATALPEEVMAPQIFAYLSKCPVWVAYNCSFDLRMLAGVSRRQQIEIPKHICLDALECARDFVTKDELESHKLSDVTRYLFPEQIEKATIRFHDSLGDVRATGMVFELFLQKYWELLQADKKQHVKKQIYPVRYARYWQNPNRKSQQRLCVVLDGAPVAKKSVKKANGDKETKTDNFGLIYWDLMDHCWKSKSDRVSKKLFETADIANIEDQVIKKYGWKYHTKDITWLAQRMAAEH